MKLCLTAAAVALASVPALAQGVETGVSNPEPVIISAQGDEAPAKAAKPSAAIPMQSPKPMGYAAGGSGAAAGTVYGPYVPYRGAGGGTGAEEAAASAPGSQGDPDAEIVMKAPERPGEVREGTLLRVQLRDNLSTVTTAPGTRFTAELVEAVEKDGRVVLPVGSLIEGRVTHVHGGRRISGAATLHLEPRTATLPDGTHYAIRAQLIDTDQTAHSKVDREGTLVRRDHPKETLAAVGLATGGAATAGAMIGGGVGAAVGAGIGAGAGTIVWLKQDRQEVVPKDALLVFSLTEPMPLMPDGSGPMSRIDEPTRPRVSEGSGAHGSAGSIVE